MRKAIIILSFLAVITSCCNNNSQNHSEPVATATDGTGGDKDRYKNQIQRKVKYYFRANGGSVVFFDDGTAYKCARCDLGADLENYEPNLTYEEYSTYLVTDDGNTWELFDEQGINFIMDWVIIPPDKISSRTIAGLNERFLQFYDNYEGWHSVMQHYRNTDNIGLGVINPKNYHFRFATNKTGELITEIENIETQSVLIPLMWKPDYLIFFMTVVGVSENMYEVQANNEMTVWVFKNDVDFYTWEQLLKERTTCITADIVYREKDINSESLEQDEHNTHYALIVENVDGDWVYVKAENEEGTVFDYYWVRWKNENNKLLIRPIFLM